MNGLWGVSLQISGLRCYSWKVVLTLESLQYTTGMGLVCGPNGALLVLQPFSPMWIGPPDSSYLRRACFSCHCTNIAPDEPRTPAVQRPACVVDIGEDEVGGPVPSYPPNPRYKISTTASGDLVEEDDPIFERFVWLNITQATLELVKTPHWGSSSMVPTPDSSNSSTSNSLVRPTPRENAECQDTDDDDDGADDQRPSKTQKTGEWAPEGQGDAGQGGSSDPQPPATQQCEVPCSHPSDCDTTNNYLCTSSSPLPDDPPIDPSFRAFCCQLVTELSDSIAASQALGPNTCRDRCLLANTTANATTWTNGTTWTNTTLEILAVPDQSYPGLALECPCNCNYVSPACCLSIDGVVFEDPSEKSPLGVQAPNRTVCCDGMTGGWRKAAVVRDGYAGDPACPSTPSGVTELELTNA